MQLTASEHRAAAAVSRAVMDAPVKTTRMRDGRVLYDGDNVTFPEMDLALKLIEYHEYHAALIERRGR